ncbi:MAG: Quinolinate synthetase complex, A subunit [Candidatus Magasanikbacteria bacterium GW2011_GWD2_43_18]|uniref:Quinolinate synthase n=1 Tax=Candidatus Magasanikbacteria bacterium GW2011_GWE2_42_7 TaxID=1619052 RepID=A0A0G1DIA2_9BACT|nr:MAG: Quinolinate synthetase complex, A subunit [Candidatus Magasanikbacteria bacterium GW2011_GWC2_42_27]KKS70556.1 MAG: Quinolinate synthetase complex, A subunit [Candidatus Magasanikbacteria bacterium GW2011_GWE2_42_7]KKT03839.1 MAG: Quinolinate synthetase complex, A subunit [Candidatus Magasanikbacteria bacterium GW2011_GWD2_43_18]KKT25506.1 MAG: Quinolinate synthetase complex, A subunit [Candidatus Magasanikbacteria bacterium GW2011_GWA2_43_9]
MTYTDEQLKQETERLYEKLKHTEWSRDDVDVIAPMTLEINIRKKEQNAIILAHSYQTPDIMYGVADFLGDSYSLSKIAAEHPADKIIFCSVHFMGETAKILSPEKDVLVPAMAGCSLAESITAEDVRELRTQHPNAGVVCYVNTSAAVKAECDVCCTSANVVDVIDAMPQDEVIFVPDKLMGENVQKLTKKKLILWDGTCIVHELFTVDTIKEIRAQHPGVKILAHTECNSSVVDAVDMAGSTSDMLRYIASSDAQDIMLVTECGITDRVKTEFVDKHIVGACSLCPYMKKIMLRDILVALKNPRPDQIIEIPEDIRIKAKQSLDRMLEIVPKK